MATVQQAVIDFHRYPPIGTDDWRYGFATGKIRCLETTMLSRATLLDLANAESFSAAMDLLSSTEYSAGGAVESFAQIEELLLQRRHELRTLFIALMQDPELVELLRARHDFANMRLAIRRVVTDRPIGLDYSDFGSVPAEEFEEAFEQENYSRFPMYLQEAIEEAVLAYYENKDIRSVDYAIDRCEAKYRIRTSEELGSVFLLSFYRVRIDLTNIRTLLRLKAAERDERDLFLPGGFVEIERLVHGLDLGYEGLAPLFFATPYYEVVEGGVAYFTTEQSFLRLERLCEEYLFGFLRTTRSITAGPQPIIAYLLLKENEIRMVRMLLSAKNNGMDAKLILDRLGE
ncbi:MAG: V-type ATPase subunit [Sedimentisphaerales bacterium]|nr:V-type ATPase subunit [Sedimentisphaerales bacterium]